MTHIAGHALPRSGTARTWATRGPVVITGETRKIMKKLLEEVQNGTFAREWIKEGESNLVNFEALRKREAEHQIEIVGEKLRGLMSWLKKG